MRIVFLGSADFGIPALAMLLKRHEVAAVVTTPKRSAGRGLRLNKSPIGEFAEKEGIAAVFTPESLSDPQFLADIGSVQADCFVVVAFRLLPRVLFSLPQYGTLNIHASLLPAYRGPAPIQRAIEAGATKTGVTIFRIDEGIDTGEILRQVETAISPEETTPELYQRLSLLGVDALESVLLDLAQGRCFPIVQRHELAGKAPKLKKNEGLIDWNLSAAVIYNKIRAFKPFPGTYTFVNGIRLGIDWARPETCDRKAAAAAGTVIKAFGNSFEIQTGSGILHVLAVRPEGRRSMATGDYLRGTSIKEGSRLNE